VIEIFVPFVLLNYQYGIVLLQQVQSYLFSTEQ
jgi:hypothetical protein